MSHMFSSRPNIVIVMADSWDGRLVMNSKSPAHTPHTDRLCEQAAVFHSACCNYPLCCPSRSSFWSGQWAHRLNAWNNYCGLPESIPTFMEPMAQSGYRTHRIGTLDFRSGGHTLKSRLAAWLRSSGLKVRLENPVTTFSTHHNHRCNEPDWDIVDQARHWLSCVGDEAEPFCLYVGFRLPHPYRDTCSFWLDQVDKDRITTPADEGHEHPAMKYMRTAKGCDKNWTDDEIHHLRRRYYAMVSEADAMVGEIYNAVVDNGLHDSTLFIFLSDHGEMNLEHGQVFKNTLYEPSLRVPLIVTGPGVVPSEIHTPVSLVDMAPTLMQLAGIDDYPSVDGESLVPAITGKSDDLRGWTFAEYHAHGQPMGGFMFRDQTWKYVAYPGMLPQLFNLQQDPDEICNLAEDESNSNILQRYDQKLRQLIDYEQVNSQVIEEDRLLFAQWKRQVSRQEYEQMMQELAPPWSVEQQQQVEAWLRAGSEGSSESFRIYT